MLCSSHPVLRSRSLTNIVGKLRLKKLLPKTAIPSTSIAKFAHLSFSKNPDQQWLTHNSPSQLKNNHLTSLFNRSRLRKNLQKLRSNLLRRKDPWTILRWQTDWFTSNLSQHTSAKCVFAGLHRCCYATCWFLRSASWPMTTVHWCLLNNQRTKESSLCDLFAV